MQEFVSLKRTLHTAQAASQPGQQLTGQLHTGSAGNPVSPDGGRHARSERAEELHAQQAVLNQLKEVPIKSMNASLLVTPLLDYGKSGNTVGDSLHQQLLSSNKRCCMGTLAKLQTSA